MKIFLLVIIVTGLAIWKPRRLKGLSDTLQGSEDRSQFDVNIEISDYWNQLNQEKNWFLNYDIKSSNKQQASVFVYITSLKKDLSEIKNTEFFLGRSWKNKVFRGKTYKNRLGFRTSTNGSFLCVCRITFNDPDKSPVILD